MTIGGTDKQLHKSPMVYAAIMPKSDWFTIYVKAMYLEVPPMVVRNNNGTKTTLNRRVEKLQNLNATKLNKGEIIFDSGTTDTFLPKLMKKPFEKAWEKLMGSPYKEFKTLGDDVVLPDFLIQMRAAAVVQGEDVASGVLSGGGRLAHDLDAANPNDPIFVMRSKHYLRKYGKDILHMTEKEGDGAILGAYVMMGHDILHDVENNRVGFAESDCQLESLL